MYKAQSDTCTKEKVSSHVYVISVDFHSLLIDLLLFEIDSVL